MVSNIAILHQYFYMNTVKWFKVLLSNTSIFI